MLARSTPGSTEPRLLAFETPHCGRVVTAEHESGAALAGDTGQREWHIGEVSGFAIRSPSVARPIRSTVVHGGGIRRWGVIRPLRAVSPRTDRFACDLVSHSSRGGVAVRTRSGARPIDAHARDLHRDPGRPSPKSVCSSSHLARQSRTAAGLAVAGSGRNELGRVSVRLMTHFRALRVCLLGRCSRFIRVQRCWSWRWASLVG